MMLKHQLDAMLEKSHERCYQLIMIIIKTKFLSAVIGFCIEYIPFGKLNSGLISSHTMTTCCT